MSRLNFLLVLIICLMFLQCSKRSNPTDYEVPIDLASVQKKLVESDNKFGLKLFKEINKVEKDSNVFISPLSVSMALGMTYNGAAGETREAMHNTLEFGDLSIEEVNECYRQMIDSLTQLDPKVEFQIANSIWYRLDFTPREEFINLCKKYFNALVRGLDFGAPDAASIINSWVEENTNGKIKDLVDDPINPFTVMFLINAIYFNGTWTYEFDKNETKDDWFYLPDGSKKRCKMMEQRGLYKYYENDAFQAIELPYGDGEFSMTIFLPHGRTTIDSLIAEFNQENLNYWLSCFKSDSVDIYLPKFKLEYEKILNDELIALGMGIAFAGADFSRMFEGGGVFISKVWHKTFVEVNEEGTEAAAATVVEISYGGGPSGLYMRVDQPFVFMIREHQSQTILFIGKIVDPTYE